MVVGLDLLAGPLVLALGLAHSRPGRGARLCLGSLGRLFGLDRPLALLLLCRGCAVGLFLGLGGRLGIGLLLRHLIAVPFLARLLFLEDVGRLRPCGLYLLLLVGLGRLARHPFGLGLLLGRLLGELFRLLLLRLRRRLLPRSLGACLPRLGDAFGLARLVLGLGLGRALLKDALLLCELGVLLAPPLLVFSPPALGLGFGARLVGLPLRLPLRGPRRRPARLSLRVLALPRLLFKALQLQARADHQRVVAERQYCVHSFLTRQGHPNHGIAHGAIRLRLHALHRVGDAHLPHLPAPEAPVEEPLVLLIRLAFDRDAGVQQLCVRLRSFRRFWRFHCHPHRHLRRFWRGRDRLARLLGLLKNGVRDVSAPTLFGADLANLGHKLWPALLNCRPLLYALLPQRQRCDEVSAKVCARRR